MFITLWGALITLIVRLHFRCHYYHHGDNNYYYRNSDGDFTSNSTVSIGYNSITYVDYFTGDESDVSVSWIASHNDCNTTYYTDYTSYASNGANCATSALSTLSQSNTYNSPVCRGFITAVTYYIKHDQTAKASITNVNVDIKLTDVPFINVSSTNSATTVFASVKQEFGVKFMDVGVASGGHSADLGNLVNR